MSEPFYSPIETPECTEAPAEAIRVLVIDDRETVRAVCRQALEPLGYHCLACESASAALEMMERQQVELVIADIGTAISWDELLQEMRSRNSRVEVAIMTASADVPKAIKALHFGAAEYIVKPFTVQEIRIVIERLAQTLTLKDENRRLLERLQSRHRFGKMVGQAPAMQRVFRVIQKVSCSRVPVLILGESGTGKELVAQSIHEIGPWRNRPFIPIDCGALAPALIESELFGYVRGAFTGAVHSKEGLLETARAGTLFFDEIGEVPVELQSRLLRTIQEKEFRPVGGTRRITFEGRIIAATNRDLKAAVEQGSFRKDLFFRLNVVSITLPPLRERRADIPLLAEHILQRLSASRAGLRTKAPWVLSSEVLDRFLTYEWPGNVRELQNCLERAVTLGSGPLIQISDLPSNLQSPVRGSPSVPERVIPLEEMEQQAIDRALTSTGGDKIMAARLLGIGKTTLYRKLSKYQKSKQEPGKPDPRS